ncbi:NAD(P)-binding protein [Microthyrium microscopicum]|uniref:NAD(P)-binding protein n=1 Tax=Microthyrium microscopicum TaxID=703497 RepID=A0A6A6TYZ9_9PEZI|nr:NAD(P)-binding protein [Microthyrium microscopicum]
MGQNILITGAAGYIGGSIVADFISRTAGPIKAANISAAVRSEEQSQSLSKLGVNVVKVDLSDETAVMEVIVSNKIDIVIHTASSMDSRLASHLIKGLGRNREISGKETYFIHSSVTTLFAPEVGWEDGEVRDTDPLFEKEKEMGDQNPVRKTNLLVVELAQTLGVTSINIALPFVYGRGSGQWKKLSANIPAHIRSGIAHKVVYKFDKDGNPPTAHISDLVALYGLLTERILQGTPIPSGKDGYYFAIAHTVGWWEIMDGLAKALYARGLVEEPKTPFWPSDEVAADYLGFPRMFLRAMGTTSGQLVPVNAYRLGWQPKWDKERFLKNIDDEVQAVLDLDKTKVKTTVFDSLLSGEK